MKTILLSLPPSRYLSSAVCRSLLCLFIPFGFTAGGTDSTLLMHTHVYANKQIERSYKLIPKSFPFQQDMLQEGNR